MVCASQKKSYVYSHSLTLHTKSKVGLASKQVYNIGLLSSVCTPLHSHSENTGLETHGKVLLYVFVHVFFVGVCALLH